MDYIDDLVNQVKATARQAAEGVRDQADAAATALRDGSEQPPGEQRDPARLSEVGESIRGTVPKASADPEQHRDDSRNLGARRPWRD